MALACRIECSNTVCEMCLYSGVSISLRICNYVFTLSAALHGVAWMGFGCELQSTRTTLLPRLFVARPLPLAMQRCAVFRRCTCGLRKCLWMPLLQKPLVTSRVGPAERCARLRCPARAPTFCPRSNLHMPHCSRSVFYPPAALSDAALCGV